MTGNRGYMSPRQKMINLMYIVLTAMLALNVSSDVLDGFSQVNEGLARSNATLTLRNDAIMTRLETIAGNNREKGLEWLEKGVSVRLATDSVLQTIDSLKLAIVLAADGENGNLSEVRHREDVEATFNVMLASGSKGGLRLREEIEKYRSMILTMVTDSAKRSSVAEALNTNPVDRDGPTASRLWEEHKFDNRPVVAALTLLTKLQNDVKFAEGEALSSLLTNVDAGDRRVNRLEALVIPQSRTVIVGEPYTARIVLAAIDTTSLPTICIEGQQLPGGGSTFEVTPTSAGEYSFRGEVEVKHDDGSVTRHSFSSDYSVIEPIANVSATMMNVLYAGIDNPINISVPGVAGENIHAIIDNGTLKREGTRWVARPSRPATAAVVTVNGMKGGRLISAGSVTFRVRDLPDPVAYIETGTERNKGVRPVAKSSLLKADGIGAAVDDGILDIPFKVTSFETVFIDQMGNSMPEKSEGNQFSQRQKEKIGRLTRGKRFYISRIMAVGPDGSERLLNPIEVTVN